MLVLAILIMFQDRGWEPDAVLNWLALAGWGTSHETVQVPTPKNESSKSKTTRTAAPDSTAVMSLAELTENVCNVLPCHHRN
jgi:glutamyl-tRNA synthetase